MSRFNYCPACGGKLHDEKIQDRIRSVCNACGRINFENPIVGVAAVILDAQGRILMVRRSPDTTYSGLWCIPCGYVEYDEDIRTAVIREVKEETGLDIACGEVYAVHSNFHNPKQHTVGIWFKCSITGGTPTPGDDADAIDWFSPNNPPPLAFPTDQLVLTELTEKCK